MIVPWMQKNPEQVAALKASQILEDLKVDIDFNELFTDNAEPCDIERCFDRLIHYLKFQAGECELDFES